jgi:hypothetical protein
MGKLMGGVALLAAGAFLFVAQAYAADIGVAGTKYIVIDKGPGAQKSVYVSKDPGANKNGNDIENISVVLKGTYDGAGTATQEFDVPSGSINGWVADKDTVAKFVNKTAPVGPTTAKVGVIKPQKLLKLVAKSTGDTAELDMIGVGAPSGSVFTDYQVTSGGTTDNFCTEWQGCAFKEIAAGAGRKLVCKGGIADVSCAANGTPAVMTFTTSDPNLGVAAGVAKNGGSGGTTLKTLHVGGLNLGGGCNQDGGACGIVEGGTPGGSSNQFNASCSATSCAISARSQAQTGSINNCSAAGCKFGTFLPIANTATSTCVRNVFSAGGSGTLNLTDLPTGQFTGSVPLTSNTTLTGNGASPCPLCLGGTPLVVNSGTCDSTWLDSSSGHSSTEGAPCTPSDSAGDTYDCVPSGADLGGLTVDLTPFSSAQVTADTGGTGNFCGQGATEPGSIGCFSTHKSTGQVCDYIEENGINATGITIGGGPKTAQLVSIFCVPPVGGIFGGLINGAADLPGPGATALPGTLELN